MAEKPLLWVGSALADLRVFPEDSRRLAGFQLRRVQAGLQPSDWKPMHSVGMGVLEIRIHTEREHRILYIARFSEGVYVLHAFEKKAKQTPVGDLNLARQRLSHLLLQRSRRKEG